MSVRAGLTLFLVASTAAADVTDEQLEVVKKSPPPASTETRMREPVAVAAGAGLSLLAAPTTIALSVGLAAVVQPCPPNTLLCFNDQLVAPIAGMLVVSAFALVGGVALMVYGAQDAPTRSAVWVSPAGIGGRF
jgi:hypothetical protein